MTDYYVKNGGNDLLSGLDDTNAWETWGKVKGEAYSAGDTVSFKRGDTWNIGTNAFWAFALDGNSGAYITLDAYGSGTLPIIDAEETLTGGWTLHDTNIWKRAWTDHVRRCRLDGVDSFWADTIGEVDGITYNWCWASGVLYVYATENPDTAYSEVKVTDDNAIIFLVRDATYIKFQNLRLIGGNQAWRLCDGYDQEYLEINGCDVWYGLRAIRAEQSAGGGNTSNHITVYGNDFDGKLNMLSLVGSELNQVCKDGIVLENECDDWLISTNTFSGMGHSAFGIGAYDGTPTQGCNNNIVEYNICDGTGSPYLRFGGCSGNDGKCTGNIFRYNIEKNCNVRSQIGGNDNIFCYNLFYHKTDVPVTNKSNITEGVGFYPGDGDTCDGNMIYNNVFYDIFNEAITFGAYASVQNNEVRNNIVMEGGQGGDQTNIGLYFHNSTGTGNVITDNCFYDLDTVDVINYRGTPMTVAEADTEAEFSDNISSDPLFVDATNDDFHIPTDSPCRNAGVDVGLTEDFDGVSVPQETYPAIGAYEVITMTEYRVPSTTKVTGMIQTHADLLEQHGISSGLDASRPAAGTDGNYYFSTDAGKWSRDNGTTWDEVAGLSEVYIQGLIDASITTHEGNADAHHSAPTYDGGTDEVVFEI